MKKLLLLSALFIYAFTSDTKKSDKSLLFVHTAESAQVTSNNNIIMPLERDIFAFTDRPYRKHYWLNGEQYASLWSTDGTNSFKTDPPNAVLTWVEKDVVKELEVIITDAIFDGNQIRYTFKDIVIDSKDLRQVSIFVDAIAPTINTTS